MIGAYVRCSVGCSLDPKSEATKAAEIAAKSRRGEPGHVDYCACKPCTIRRRAVTLMIGTKKGKTASAPWDGVTTPVHVKFPSDSSDRVRFWKVLDGDGAVLLDGMCDVSALPGQDIRLDIRGILSRAGLHLLFQVSSKSIRYDLKDLLPPDTDWKSLYTDMGPFGHPPKKPANFGR